MLYGRVVCVKMKPSGSIIFVKEFWMNLLVQAKEFLSQHLPIKDCQRNCSLSGIDRYTLLDISKWYFYLPLTNIK